MNPLLSEDRSSRSAIRLLYFEKGVPVCLSTTSSISPASVLQLATFFTVRSKAPGGEESKGVGGELQS